MNLYYLSKIFLLISQIPFVDTSINFVFSYSDEEANQIVNLNFADELLMVDFKGLEHLKEPLRQALMRKEIPLYEFNRRMEMLTGHRKLKTKIVNLNNGNHQMSVGFTGIGEFKDYFAQNWEEDINFDGEVNPVKTVAKYMGHVYDKAMPSFYNFRDENGRLKVLPRQDHLLATADHLYTVGVGGGEPPTLQRFKGNLYAEGYDAEIFEKLLEEQGFGQGRLPKLSRKELQRRIGNVMDKYFYSKGINANYISRSGVGTIHIAGHEPIPISYKPETDWKMNRLLTNNADLPLAKAFDEALLSLYEADQFPNFNEQTKAIFSMNYNQRGTFKKRIDEIDKRKNAHQKIMNEQRRTGLRRTNSFGQRRIPDNKDSENDLHDAGDFNEHRKNIPPAHRYPSRSMSLSRQRLEHAQKAPNFVRRTKSASFPSLTAKHSFSSSANSNPSMPRNAHPKPPPNRLPTLSRRKKMMHKRRNSF